MGSFGNSKGLRLGTTSKWYIGRPVMGGETIGTSKRRQFLEIIEKVVEKEGIRKVGFLLSHTEITYESSNICVRVFIHPGPFISDMETREFKNDVARLNKKYLEVSDIASEYFYGCNNRFRLRKLNTMKWGKYNDELMKLWGFGARGVKDLWYVFHRGITHYLFGRRFNRAYVQKKRGAVRRKKSIRKDFLLNYPREKKLYFDKYSKKIKIEKNTENSTKKQWIFKKSFIYKFSYGKKIIVMKPSIYNKNKVSWLRIIIIKTLLEFSAIIKRLGERFFNKNVIVRIAGVSNKDVTADMLSRYLKTKLTQKYRVSELIKHIKWGMRKSVGLSGYRVHFSGRFAKKQRAGFEVKGGGQMPLGSIGANIEYSYKKAVMKYGCCGVKVWLYRKGTKEWRYPVFTHL